MGEIWVCFTSQKNLAPPDRSVEFVPLEARRSSATLPPPKRAKRNGRFGAPKGRKNVKKTVENRSNFRFKLKIRGYTPLKIKMEPKKSSNKKDVFQKKKCEANLHFCVFHLNFPRVYVVCVWDSYDSWRSQPESNSPCFSWPPSKPRLSDLSSCDPCEHHASQSLWKSHIAILLMEDILYHLICSESHCLQGFYIISQVVNLVNNGINYISSGTGCLPSSVVLRFVSHLFIYVYHVWITPCQEDRMSEFWCRTCPSNKKKMT